MTRWPGWKTKNKDHYKQGSFIQFSTERHESLDSWNDKVNLDLFVFYPIFFFSLEDGHKASKRLVLVAQHPVSTK